jgi:hypothetical protein
MHKQIGPGPFVGDVELDVELEHYHSHWQVADSVTLLMKGESIYDHEGMTDLH